MRDDKGRTPLHQPIERLLHQGLALGVQRRGCLVENEDARVLEEGARNGNALLLSA